MNSRSACLLLSVITLTACVDQKTQDLLAEKESELKRMQENWVQVQSETSAQLQAFKREIELIETQYQLELDQQERQNDQLRKQIETLRAANRELRILLARAPKAAPSPAPPPPPPVSVVNLNQTLDALQRQSTFPIEVLNPSGRKVVTGQHTLTRFVENGEMIKDGFGRERVAGDWVKEDVNQYGYQARFGLQNKSDQTVQVTARAGLASGSYTLQPGQVVEGLELLAARGGSLWVLCDGQSKRVDIEYSEE